MFITATLTGTKITFISVRNLGLVKFIVHIKQVTHRLTFIFHVFAIQEKCKLIGGDYRQVLGVRSNSIFAVNVVSGVIADVAVLFA